ncbi:MAG: FAD-dependent oxidoreductase [Actinobacteria bacterium]|nr:MAG: FAD-dependent oxidoreductase [Actinomycetota bacterium]
MSSRYDVIIIGAGPAGIFSALELTRLPGARRILIVEKGHSIARRRCPARETACVGCRTCDIMTGWGGAGAFSDGKLTLTTEVGGWLPDYVERPALEELVRYGDEMWLEFGATDQVHGPDAATATSLEREATLAGMKLVPMRIRHLGTDRSPEVLDAMREHLESVGVEVRTEVGAHRIVASGGRVSGVELTDGTLVEAEAVVAAPGREGANWLAEQAHALGLTLTNNAVDIGVRVECPAPVMERLTDPLYEAKLVYHTKAFGDSVRTFCMNPYGEVTTESYGDVVTVNGHSYAERKTDATNFAVLVSQRFTEPFRDPITYGRSIAKLANLLGDGILVQRYSDLKAGRRSTPERMAQAIIEPTMGHATPGDLSAVLPYRHLTDIVEFIEAMDALAPGLAGPNTFFYGVEVKFYSSRVEVGRDLQTQLGGLYAIGDGAGVTRGLLQAGISGIVAARAIAGERSS